MSATSTYRRFADRQVGVAYQYGENQPWDKEAISKVAAFVTGIDVDNYVEVSNERILDVVRPVLTEWDANRGKAPIEVFDTEAGKFTRIDLGDWIVRFGTPEEPAPLVFVAGDRMLTYYEPVDLIEGVYKSNKDTSTEDLTKFLYEKCFSGKSAYRDLATTTAKALISAGWRKEEK